MGLKIGIVGLPNVGKSTLFNALTKAKSAQASNYPFCTIDPNVGIVEVPDHRLKALADLYNPEKIIPTAIEFVDIAGLVKGASEGEGLGNKFLANIRECDAIAQVIRIFKDENVIHVHGNVDAKRDIEVIESELLLADMQTVTKRVEKARSEAKSGDKEKVVYAELVERLEKTLGEGTLAINAQLTEEERAKLADLHLLTAKPLLYILNVNEDQIKEIEADKLRQNLGLPEHAPLVPISAKIESELVEFEDEEAKAYLEEMGLKETGLNLLIAEAYRTLGLITYLTAGPKEVRAWTIKRGIKAPQAAGVIHTDFEKGFIKAEVIQWDKLVETGNEARAREKGWIRQEGKEYVVRDGDVMHFRFNN